MPDLPHPVSPADLIRLGFDESTAEAATQEIAELVQAVFGPFELRAAEGWAASEEEDLGATELRQRLVEAAKADDPLAVLAAYPDVQVMLERRMRLRWSSRRARALGHPESLNGQTWSSLSEAARADVQEALQDLVVYASSLVLRHRPERGDLDTFLSELAGIYVSHTPRTEDRAGRAKRRLLQRTDVPHSPTSRFIRLAELILSRVSLPLPGDLRLHANGRSLRGLSDRWKRRREDEVFGRREPEAKSRSRPDKGDPTA